MIADWPAHAACSGGNDELLFTQGAEQNVARWLCRDCPVRYECLADALDNRIEYGVWGGMTEGERRALLRRHPQIVSWRRTFEAAMQQRAAATTPVPVTVTVVKDADAAFAAIRASMVTSEYATCYADERLPLVRFLIKIGAREQDAFDAAQDAFVEAYRRWEQIANPRAWLRTVALRHLPQRGEVPLGEWHDLPDSQPDGIQISNETRTVIAALRRLPMIQRQVMAWTMDGFKPAEIAAEMNIRPEAVRQALARARTGLKRILLKGGGQL